MLGFVPVAMLSCTGLVVGLLSVLAATPSGRDKQLRVLGWILAVVSIALTFLAYDPPLASSGTCLQVHRCVRQPTLTSITDHSPAPLQ